MKFVYKNRYIFKTDRSLNHEEQKILHFAGTAFYLCEFDFSELARCIYQRCLILKISHLTRTLSERFLGSLSSILF